MLPIDTFSAHFQLLTCPIRPKNQRIFEACRRHSQSAQHLLAGLIALEVNPLVDDIEAD